MVAPVPNIEPKILVAGDTWTWTRSLPDYAPNDGWVLTYALRHPTIVSAINVTATAENNRHKVSVAAALTATYGAGDWTWDSYVTKAATSERYRIGSGTFIVRPNLSAQSGAFDGRSHAKKMLDAITALLEGRATEDIQAYQIGSRSLTRLKRDELIKWQTYYRGLVEAEENKTSSLKYVGATFRGVG